MAPAALVRAEGGRAEGGTRRRFMVRAEIAQRGKRGGSDDAEWQCAQRCRSALSAAMAMSEELPLGE